MTTEILEIISGTDIEVLIGSYAEIELWQNKKSTSHKYNLREEILTVTK